MAGLGRLYDLTPLDPHTCAAVAILFAMVALIASYLPARRATQGITETPLRSGASHSYAIRARATHEPLAAVPQDQFASVVTAGR